MKPKTIGGGGLLEGEAASSSSAPWEMAGPAQSGVRADAMWRCQRCGNHIQRGTEKPDEPCEFCDDQLASSSSAEPKKEK
jgi:rubrerythrin